MLPLYQHLGHLLRRTDQLDRANFLTFMRPYDLTAPQYATLLALLELGPSSPRDIGHYIAMEVSNLHGVLKRLEARGLICSSASKHDKRRKTISLTEAGQELLRTLRPLAERASRVTLQVLTEQEQRTLLGLLTKIALPGEGENDRKDNRQVATVGG